MRDNHRRPHDRRTRPPFPRTARRWPAAAGQRLGRRQRAPGAGGRRPRHRHQQRGRGLGPRLARRRPPARRAGAADHARRGRRHRPAGDGGHRGRLFRRAGARGRAGGRAARGRRRGHQHRGRQQGSGAAGRQDRRRRAAAAAAPASTCTSTRASTSGCAAWPPRPARGRDPRARRALPRRGRERAVRARHHRRGRDRRAGGWYRHARERPRLDGPARGRPRCTRWASAASAPARPSRRRCTRTCWA